MNKRVGIFDSGLGGLTVLRELRRTLPGVDYIYLGDNARTPYGSKGESTIIRYSRECAKFLVDQQIDILVVACNTASAAALHVLKEELTIPVIGTIDPAVSSALASSRNNRIGVIGTFATIQSGAYQKALSARNTGLTVVTKACPLFVPLVEEGLVSGEIVESVVAHYLESIVTEDVDTLILGCTHYPILLEAIQEFLTSRVKLVECSSAIAETVKGLVENPIEQTSGMGSERYFTTDEVGKFTHLATLFQKGSAIEAAKVSI